MLDRCVLKKGVVNGQHCAARISEHRVNAQINQRLDQYVRAAMLGHRNLLSKINSAPCCRAVEKARCSPLFIIKWLVNTYLRTSVPKSAARSEEHTTELQSLIHISYAVS